MIKYFTFYRENNKFDDILKDNNIKKVIHLKIKWYQHLMIGIGENGNDRHFSYITLKYGDDMKKLDYKDMKKPQYKDLTPIKGVDYSPKR